MCVFEYLFEIQLEGRAWRLSSASLDSHLNFDTYAQAEQRARWLAVRHEVKGLAAEIRILDACGVVIGSWRGERYQPVMAQRLDQAA